MLGDRKTLICIFFGTGMTEIMPVPLLLVYTRECSCLCCNSVELLVEICPYTVACNCVFCDAIGSVRPFRF